MASCSGNAGSCAHSRFAIDVGGSGEFQALWITRLTAACRMRGIAYSRFIYGLAEANVQINRKMLSEIAIASPTDFDAIVDIAKKHLDKSVAA